MINWRDVQERAEVFALRYIEAKDEDRDAKPFWKDLLEIFDVDPRQIGAFEERVRIHGRPGVGKIDYFAPRKFIIEHKSRGKDLDAAYRQAMDYFDALPKVDHPRHIVVSDFARIRIYDLEAPPESRVVEFTLEELPKRISSLVFLADEEVRVYKPEEPIDVKAVRAIGRLHSALKTSNYKAEHLSPLLTRIVFCCFADDTGIFEQDALARYLEAHTNPDGSDLGAHLNSIFEILNTAPEKRQTNIHSALENLPYVNGGLFSEPLQTVFASRDIRDTLLQCMEFDWSRVSPAVFGSMFQSVMDEKERHDLGAHYTSETNILKVINGLFLEELHAELASAKTSQEKLEALWEKLTHITLLDPACGCGNFLVVAYRELRRLENEIIARIYKKDADKVRAGYGVLPLDVDIKKISKMSVEHMYGIEIDSFPAEVAKLSLWLMDHKMNMELGALFGKPLRKLPLTEAPHIVQGNALRIDWETVVPKDKLSYILGNPPFLGKKEQGTEQKADMDTVWGKVKGAGILDYVTCWYKKAADLVAGTKIKVAFVSTNSITQGEQVGVLWPYLLERGFKIHFAHRTFRWSNEAAGNAGVHCVILGFADFDVSQKSLFVYADINNEPEEVRVANINPYLVDGPDVIVKSRTLPINEGPKMNYGSMPIDKGGLILSPEEAEKFKEECPEIAGLIRPYMGGEEFLNGSERFCLWLEVAPPELVRSCPLVHARVESVRNFRAGSDREATKKLAETPYKFGEIRQPNSAYILIPKVSSENRTYMPTGIAEPDVIANGSVLIIPNANLFIFGVLTSMMHMAWMRAVAGRMKSDYQYSAQIVYNNFPWPENPIDEQKKVVEDAAQAVLDARAQFPISTLADLYDPNTMPKVLLDAHHALDRAVDACYGIKKPFLSEPARLEFLFERYKTLTED